MQESSTVLGEEASGQAAFLDLEAAFRAEGGTRPQEQAVLKWPEFQVQDRLGSHRANRPRCHVQDSGSWPAVWEQLQSITSSLETPGLGQERPPCSRRDRINAKVPSIHGTLSHRPPHHDCRRPPTPTRTPSSGCQRAVCDCVLSIHAPAPRGQEPAVGGGSERREGKGPPSFSVVGCLFVYPLWLRMDLGEGREVLGLS